MANGWVTHSGSSLPTGDTCVVVSKHSSSSIIFCKNGAATVYQKETETVTEYRGLDASSAQAKVGVTDSTVHTTYYATIGSEDHSIVCVTGTKTEVSASRSNEADGWTVTARSVLYEVVGLNTNVWSTSRTLSDSSASSEEVISVESSAAFVFSFNGNELISTRTTTVKEKRHFATQSAAAAAYTASSHSYTKYKAGTNVIYYCTIPSGTERSVSVRKVSDAEGWTARATETVYGKSGNAWSVST